MNGICLRRGLSLLLSAIFCVFLSVPALADGEPPFSVGLSDSDLVLSSSIRSLTASVTPVAPAVDLPSDITYSWTSGDSSVVSVEGSGTTASIYPNSPGSTTVSFTASSESAAYTSPAVTCTVTVQGVKLNTDTLSLYTRGTSALTASEYGNFGDVTWSSGNDSVAKVDSNGTVTGVSAGSTSITATAGGYSASCTVTVEDRSASVITASVSSDSALPFTSLISSINIQSEYVLGSSLSYVTNLSVPTSAGTLYYGYVSESVPGAGVGSNENYDYIGTANGQSIQDVSFVPKTTFSGIAAIQYTGFDSSGAFFTGTIHVSVSTSSVISYSTTGQSRVDFQVADFDTVCQSRTGYDLSYVTFSLPASSSGTLYYNYSGSALDNKVSSGTAYYRSKSLYLSTVSFVPAASFTGTVSIPYQGYDTAGNSFSGQIYITVSGNATGTGNITYSTSKNTPAVFDTDDFDNLCEALTNAHLSYVRFNLPSSSIGTLYYNYTSASVYGGKVSSASYYYRTSSPYLDNVSFVPASNWTGTVSVGFTGYSTTGISFSGTVSITVKTTSSTTISYSALENTAAAFDVSDFDDLCEELTDAHLNYVRFNLPSSYIGTLYYNYTSASVYGGKVSSASYYYRSSSPYLDNVSFVPASDWTGTVSVSFTGYSTYGDSFSGTVNITIRSTTSTSISYSGKENTAIAFNMADFDNLCESLTDTHLSRVRFTLPSSSVGTLYYQYSSSSSYTGKVSSSSYYYRSSSPYLDDVSFVPATNWSGTVSISFTGYSTGGDTFSGTVSISVTGTANAGIIYYSTTAGKPVTFQTASFQTACNAQNAGTFVSAIFNLPAAGFGQLRYNYVSSSQTGSVVSSTQSYSAGGTPAISAVTFVPAAGYTGTAAISYRGLDSRGTYYTGTILVIVAAASSSYFTDLGGYSWAVASIDYLHNAGVVNGTSAGVYSPAASISRGSFMLMVCRAFDFNAASGTGFADVPTDSVYADAVTTAQALGIAQGNGAYFYPANPLTREQAAVFLLRAMRADGWTISDGQRSALSGYTDSASVSDYAVGPMAAMVQLGILKGSASGQLNPKGTLTRAQMAVILYRALTLS